MLEVLHDSVFVIGRQCHLEQLFHHGADGLFLVFRHTNAHFRQQLIHELLLRDIADDFFFGTVVQIDALTVDRKGQISTLKETCHQPMDVIFHKAIGCFHKAILDGFHRSFHVHPGVTCHELQHIIQRVNIGFSGISQCQRQLVAGLEHLPDVCFAHRCINIGQLVVNRLHQSSDSLVDAAGHFLAGGVQHIAIDIDGSLFQSFRQIKLGVTVAFPHLHALCFLNGLILGKLHRSILAQEPLNFQVCPHFRQERIIIWQNHKDFLALAGEQAQRTIIGAALIPRGQHTEADIVILVCLIGAVIHCLIEGERIPSTKAGVLILLAGENVLIDHLRNLRDDLRHLHIFFFDFVVNFLFLIGQEYIDGAILLDQHLAHQHFQCILHLCFQRDAIIVNAGNHEAHDVVHVGFDL